MYCVQTFILNKALIQFLEVSHYTTQIFEEDSPVNYRALTLEGLYYNQNLYQ